MLCLARLATHPARIGQRVFFFFFRPFPTATRCQSYVGRATTTAGGPGLGPQGQAARPFIGGEVEHAVQCRAVARPRQWRSRPRSAQGCARHGELDRNGKGAPPASCPAGRTPQHARQAAHVERGAGRGREQSAAQQCSSGLLSRSPGPPASAGRPSRVRGTCGACVAPRPAARHRPPPRRMDVDDAFWLEETRVLRRSTALLRWRW